MKRLLLLAVVLAAGVAMAVGFTLTATTDTTFTDCSSGGSSAQTLSASGSYWVRTSSAEGLFMCMAASSSTCASNGTFLPPGSSVLINFSSSQLSISCRSASSTGDLYLAPAM